MIRLQVGNQFPSCFESFCDIMAPVDQKHQKHRFHRSFSDISYHQVHSYHIVQIIDICKRLIFYHREYENHKESQFPSYHSMWVYLELSLRKHDLYGFDICFILSGNQFNASAVTKY